MTENLPIRMPGNILQVAPTFTSFSITVFRSVNFTSGFIPCLPGVISFVFVIVVFGPMKQLSPIDMPFATSTRT